MRTLIGIMLAGAVGAAARYGLDAIVAARVSGPFPWGTFIVNITGAFALGVLFTVLTRRFSIDPSVRFAVTTGFIGSYTTFSTLTLQTLQLAQDGYVGLALAYSLGSLVAGMAAVIAGVLVGRAV